MMYQGFSLPSRITAAHSPVDCIRSCGTPLTLPATQERPCNISLLLPQADFSVNQMVSEGSNVTVTVLLSGEAPAYPVKVPYNVSGTAINPYDHNASDGVIVISSGTTGSLYSRQ